MWIATAQNWNKSFTNTEHSEEDERFGELNPRPNPWIFSSNSVDSLILIHFRFCSHKCSHCTKVWHRTYRRLHLSVYTWGKKHVLTGCKRTMFCSQTFEGWSTRLLSTWFVFAQQNILCKNFQTLRINSGGKCAVSEREKCPQFLKNEIWAERADQKHINNLALAWQFALTAVKLQMFGGKTRHVWHPIRTWFFVPCPRSDATGGIRYVTLSRSARCSFASLQKSFRRNYGSYVWTEAASGMVSVHAQELYGTVWMQPNFQRRVGENPWNTGWEIM